MEVEKLADEKRQKSSIDERQASRNLFILFYTLRLLWKLSRHRMEELYKLLFPSNSSTGGNKTLFDNILNNRGANILPHAGRLAELIGISEKYFTGEYKLIVPGLTDDNWNEFIRLRKKRGEKESTLRQVEKRIKDNIQDAVEESSKQSEPFKRLLYFAKHQRKRADKTIEALFVEIESKFVECLPTVVEQADIELLKKHQEAVQRHLFHISAAITMAEWKGKK